jgi:hypothetical protein
VLDSDAGVFWTGAAVPLNLCKYIMAQSRKAPAPKEDGTFGNINDNPLDGLWSTI